MWLTKIYKIKLCFFLFFFRITNNEKGLVKEFGDNSSRRINLELTYAFKEKI